MSMLVWAMMGIAIWHFTVFLPDRFWGGIVGAFLGALIGSVLCGLVVNGFTIPGQHDTTLGTGLRASPVRSSASPACTTRACAAGSSHCACKRSTRQRPD